MSEPILYSLQNCPYAMRARLGLLLANQPVRLRAIVMKNKPEAMLLASPKATVPVLVLPDTSGGQQVVDESLDIMLWALTQSDPHNLLLSDNTDVANEMHSLIKEADEVFRPSLSKYKHAKRYHDPSLSEHRNQCAYFVAKLEARLSQHACFMGEQESLADYAILPFIRQFSRVERQWFLQAPYPHLRQWLNQHLQSQLYAKAMTKYSIWLDTGEEHLFTN